MSQLPSLGDMVATMPHAVGLGMELAEATAEGGTATIESETNFFRPFLDGTATATCRLVNAGRTTITVQTEVRNDDGKLLTMTTQTQAVLLPR